LLHTHYDVCSDQYDNSTGDTTDASLISAMTDLWDKTNDPTCLDIAFDYGKVVSRNGVFSNLSNPNDPHNGLILSGPYLVSDGSNADVHDGSKLDTFDAVIGYPTGTISLLAGYVACTLYNTAHPTSPLRYDPNELALWIATIKDASRTLANLKNYTATTSSGPPTWGTWVGDWTALTGYFSDQYGYEGNTIVSGLKQLDRLPTLTGDEATTDDYLRNEYLLDGATYYIDHWEQAVIRGMRQAGDNGRTWAIFAYLANHTTDPALAQRFTDQIQRAAEHAFRFQYRGGVWVAAGQDENQQLDAAQGPGPRLFIPPGPYPLGEGSVFATVHDTGVLDDFLALMNSQFKVAVAKFKRTYAYRKTILSSDTADEKAGSERFLNGNYLFAIDQFPDDFLNLPAKPTCTITPANLSTPGPKYFRFTIHVETATSQADLQDQLDNRVKVVRWSTQGSSWVEEKLWPENSSFFATPILDLANKNITLATAQQISGPPGEFKFEVHAWDASGQWSRDTSYQVGW
jgi:hypothetical protein